MRTWVGSASHAGNRHFRCPVYSAAPVIWFVAPVTPKKKTWNLGLLGAPRIDEEGGPSRTWQNPNPSKLRNPLAAWCGRGRDSGARGLASHWTTQLQVGRCCLAKYMKTYLFLCLYLITYIYIYIYICKSGMGCIHASDKTLRT